MGASGGPYSRSWSDTGIKPKVALIRKMLKIESARFVQNFLDSRESKQSILWFLQQSSCKVNLFQKRREMRTHRRNSDKQSMW